ncbi:MAG TPA: hypothetical protein DD619_00630 [Alphaproteobacteria bacterium]|nr:hypothetical protein [Alphaproteobacteria bacterium]
MTNAEFIAVLGSKIARLRKMRGLNQFEFADVCGKMVNTVSKIERGIGDPRLSTLLDIAKALDIPLTELLDSTKFANTQPGAGSDLDAQIIELLERCDDDAKSAVLTLLKVLTR